MEVFKGVVTTRTASSSLHGDGEIGMCRSDLDYLADAIDRARLECDIKPAMI